MADGLLVDYTNHIPQKMLELIRAHNLPAIWLNSQQPSDCIYPDDREAAERLTAHLLELGHKRVLYVDFTHDPVDPHEHYSYLERINGYHTAMQKAGLKPYVEPKAQMLPVKSEAYMTKLLQGADRPTAIITYGDIEIDLIAAVASELGLRVPHDISLATFVPAGRRYPGRDLTTCSVPEYALGRNAAQMLRRKIEQPAIPLEPQVLKFDFEAGQTCAPPSA
jgi:LacI family transcriptional regulator